MFFSCLLYHLILCVLWLIRAVVCDMIYLTDDCVNSSLVYAIVMFKTVLSNYCFF